MNGDQLKAVLKAHAEYLETGNHEKLFHLLRRLWQGIELTGLNAAWHQIITGTFRCTFYPDRRLYIQKTLVMEEIPHKSYDIVPQDQVL